ncbi:MAG: VOC family protein [Verrucomicrobia bacterium]|nr:VOC family protein [Verrucomicrobiota bacterium]
MKFSVEHIGLPARDPAELKDWYVRQLGAAVAFDTGQVPPTFFLRLPGGVMIEIYKADSSLADTSNNKLAGWRHLALRVDSLEQARDQLTLQGVIFEKEFRPAGGGGRILFFRDPEDNLLHLVERPADSVLK